MVEKGKYRLTKTKNGKEKHKWTKLKQVEGGNKREIGSTRGKPRDRREVEAQSGSALP